MKMFITPDITCILTRREFIAIWCLGRRGFKVIAPCDDRRLKHRIAVDITALINKGLVTEAEENGIRLAITSDGDIKEKSP